MSFTAPKPTPIRIRSAFEADSIASFRGRCYQRIEITKTINTPGFFTWFSARSTTMSAVAAKTSGYTLITNRQRNARFICWFYDHYRFFDTTESCVIFICHYILISKLNDNDDFGKCLFLVNVLSHHGLSRNLGRQTVVDWGSMSRETPELGVFSENEDMFHPRGTLDTSVTIPDFRFSIKMRSSLIC